MTVTYSSSANNSLFLQSTSSNFSRNEDCIDAQYMNVAGAFTTIILILPLSAFVIYLGFHQWKQQRSTSAIMGHSDFFTYNMAVMDLVGVLGYVFYICGTFAKLPVFTEAGFYVGSLPWTGQMMFPILICVERYLAVVHPIVYLRLRRGGGVRIRNIATAYVWLQCTAGPGYVIMNKYHRKASLISSACQIFLFLVTMLFCSLSVLCVLIRPRPGEQGGDRVRVHQSKQRAFCTIVIIMGVLLLRFGGFLVANVVLSSLTMSANDRCLVMSLGGWISLPSSLVLPLLFLHQAGKLPGCKHNT